MLENINPAIALPVVIFVVVLWFKFFIRKQSGKSVVALPVSLDDISMRLVGMLSEVGLERSMGDIIRAFISGDNALAAEKARATIDVMAIPDGRNAMLKDVFDKQLEALLNDPALWPAIAAKVEATRPK